MRSNSNIALKVIPQGLVAQRKKEWESFLKLNEELNQHDKQSPRNKENISEDINQAIEKRYALRQRILAIATTLSPSDWSRIIKMYEEYLQHTCKLNPDEITADIKKLKEQTKKPTNNETPEEIDIKHLIDDTKNFLNSLINAHQNNTAIIMFKNEVIQVKQLNGDDTILRDELIKKLLKHCDIIEKDKAHPVICEHKINVLLSAAISLSEVDKNKLDTALQLNSDYAQPRDLWGKVRIGLFKIDITETQKLMAEVCDTLDKFESTCKNVTQPNQKYA